MEIEDIIMQLKETAGTKKYKEILQSLSDDEIREIINFEFKDKATFIKAILFQGYKTQQAK